MFEALMPDLFVPEEQWGPNSWGRNHPATVAGADRARPQRRRVRLLGLLPRLQPGRRLPAARASTRWAWTPTATRPTWRARKYDAGFGDCRPAGPPRRLRRRRGHPARGVPGPAVRQGPGRWRTWPRLKANFDVVRPGRLLRRGRGRQRHGRQPVPVPGPGDDHGRDRQRAGRRRDQARVRRRRSSSRRSGRCWPGRRSTSRPTSACRSCGRHRMTVGDIAAQARASWVALMGTGGAQDRAPGEAGRGRPARAARGSPRSPAAARSPCRWDPVPGAIGYAVHRATVADRPVRGRRPRRR